MKTVYAVTSGCYSDYRVHCIFESETDAEAYCERKNQADRYGGFEVAEFDMYPEGESPVPHEEWHVRLSLRTNGKVDPYEWHRVFDAPIGTTQIGAVDIRPVGFNANSIDVDGSWPILSVSADGYPTKEAALKAASDRMAEIKAHREGIA